MDGLRRGAPGGIQGVRLSVKAARSYAWPRARRRHRRGGIRRLRARGAADRGPGTSVLLLEAGPTRPEAAHPRSRRVLEALPVAARLGLRHRPAGRARRPPARLPARQGARRVGIDQRDDGDPRPSRRPRRLAGGMGLGRRRGAYARSDAHFPRAAQRSPSPLTLDFLGSAAAAGIPRAADLNGADNEGVGLTPVSIRRGRRFSVVDGYLRPAMRRPNLTVVTGARATRLLVERGRARGVAYLLGEAGREEEAHAEREVVLAAGAIDTPRLLLLSGIGPPEELGRHGIPVVHALPASAGTSATTSRTESLRRSTRRRSSPPSAPRICSPGSSRGVGRSPRTSPRRRRSSASIRPQRRPTSS